MKFFEFTRSDYEYIVQEAMLDEDYQKLLEYEIKGYNRTKMARLLKVGEPTLDVMIRKLKKKIKKIL
jgi:wyosine [tRNA(Phe)-imidazoG37] synthetase (radical SAM superfamily)